MKKKPESLIAGYNGFLFGLSLTGLATVALGTLIESKLISVLIVSIGGTLFGTCFSSIISRLSGEQVLKEMRSFLESTMNTKFVSDEEKLKSFRKLWYHYRVTSIDGKLIWRHAKYDFQTSNEIGGLSTNIRVIGKYNTSYEYTVEAGIRESRFLMFVKPKVGTEPTGVQIFPFMGSEFHGIHCGFGLFQTWDGLHTIQPIMMSAFPLFEITTEGSISDEKASKFDDTWRKGMSLISSILPQLRVE